LVVPEADAGPVATTLAPASGCPERLSVTRPVMVPVGTRARAKFRVVVWLTTTLTPVTVCGT
jgi:hypothetical protein